MGHGGTNSVRDATLLSDVASDLLQGRAHVSILYDRSVDSMRSKWHKAFEEAVIRSFQPIATANGMALQKLGDGVFEIRGAEFAIRIRRGTGHLPDFVVTLGLKKSPYSDIYDASGEIGLGWIAEFYGAKLEAPGLLTPENIEQGMQNASLLTGDLCIPYVTGTRNDYANIRAFLDKKKEGISLAYDKMQFPSNVHRKWLEK